MVSREDLSRQVLCRPLEPYDRSLDMHVSHVRRKLGPAMGQSERIRSIRGTGYIYLRAGAPLANDAADPRAGSD